jgi:exosortase
MIGTAQADSTMVLPQTNMPAAQRARVPRWWICAVVLVLAGVAPFFAQHLINLWQYRPHYEFVPMLLVAFVWLVWWRWPVQAVHTAFSRLVGWTFLLAGLVTLAAALALYSPWVGAVALVLSAGGLLLLLAGREAFTTLLPVWLLLWMVVPPPFRLDDQLIYVLQGVTARGSSGLIEFAGVNHLLEGNVFRLPERELFVAEACSGVHSQLVLIAASLLLVIALYRPWLHALLLIGISLCLSSMVNIARVTVIVFAAAQWDVDWSTGWQHEVLGYSLTLIGFLLLISGDLLLAGLLAPVLDLADAEEGLTMEALPLASDPLSRLWNRVIARVTPDSAILSDPDEALPADAGDDDADPADSVRPGTPVQTVAVLLTGLMFGCLGVLQVLILVRVPTAPEVQLGTAGMELQEAWLPSDVGDWRQVEYRVTEREASSDAGRYSHIWEYRADDRRAQVSADFPFLGWHELTRCYLSTGWIEVSRKVWQDAPQGPYVEVVLRKPTGDIGHLCFSVFDGSHRPVEPRITHWRGWRGKLASGPVWTLFGLGGPQILPAQSTLQFQQFLIIPDRMEDEQQQQHRNLYLGFRRQFLNRWGSGTGAGADHDA